MRFLIIYAFEKENVGKLGRGQDLHATSKRGKCGE